MSLVAGVTRRKNISSEGTEQLTTTSLSEVMLCNAWPSNHKHDVRGGNESAIVAEVSARGAAASVEKTS